MKTNKHIEIIRDSRKQIKKGNIVSWNEFRNYAKTPKGKLIHKIVKRAVKQYKQTFKLLGKR